MPPRQYNTSEHCYRRAARILNLLTAGLMLGTGWYIWLAYDALINTVTAFIMLSGCSLFFIGTIVTLILPERKVLLMLRVYQRNIRRGIYRLTWPGRRAFLWVLLILEQRT